MTVSGLAEVVLWTRDMDRSLAFYRDLLGLELISPPELPNRFLRAGRSGEGVPAMIVLVPHPPAEAAFPAQRTGRVLHHLALTVAADGFDRLESRVRASGLETRPGVHPVLQGVRTFYVDDPDGNEVEIIAPSADRERAGDGEG